MKITFKLFAALTDYLPVEARYSNVVELDVAPDATISQIVEPDKCPTQTLVAGDVLAIWPPIAGG